MRVHCVSQRGSSVHVICAHCQNSCMGGAPYWSLLLLRLLMPRLVYLPCGVLGGSRNEAVLPKSHAAMKLLLAACTTCTAESDAQQQKDLE
jgi:hypothetical protein